MANSSLRNTLARRNHKERAQPVHRSRLGLLEKHKDYVLRARDYKSKQDRLRKLREKAAFRNKDEFYWGMVNAKTKGGVAVGDRGNEALSVDLVRLLKTQDAGYIRVQIAKDKKKVAKLRAELEITAPPASASASAGPSSEWSAAEELAEVEKLAEMGVVINPQASTRKGKGKGKAPQQGHVVFADGKEEYEAYGSSEGGAEAPGSAEAEEVVDLGWEVPETSKRRKKATAAASSTGAKAPGKDAGSLADEAREHRLDLLTTLSALLSRLRILRQAESQLSTTKNLMGKGEARRVRDAQWVEDPTQKEDENGERRRFEGKMWKWRLERKR